MNLKSFINSVNLDFETYNVKSKKNLFFRKMSSLSNINTNMIIPALTGHPYH